MKISVIVAVYNEKQHLPHCLESLLNQKGVDSEVILVDDGSRIPVQETVKDYIANKKLKIIRLQHSGTAVARNRGVRDSVGKILVFVDGDMEFEPDFISVLTDPIEKNNSKGTYSTEEYVANWNNIWARCFNYENGLKTNKRINNKADMARDFRAILKSEFEKAGGFDDTGYTDTWSLSQKLGYLPTPTKAKYYHYNPDTLGEVFSQARWIGGRQRRNGMIGSLLSLARASLPVSVISGVVKAFKYQQYRFLFFKLVYDFGIFVGIIEGRRKK